MKRTMAVILAGGEGERLSILSSVRAKPAVPFGGKYRIIDFTLSQLRQLGHRRRRRPDPVQPALAQRPHRPRPAVGPRPQHRRRPACSSRTSPAAGSPSGTAARPTRSSRTSTSSSRRPADTVLVLAGDHIYKMDYQPFVAAHRRHRADVTIAVRRVPLADATRMGILALDDNDRVVEWQEKPKQPKSDLASMGVYVFSQAGPPPLAVRGPGRLRRATSSRPCSRAARASSATASTATGRTWGRSSRYWEANMALLDGRARARPLRPRLGHPHPIRGARPGQDRRRRPRSTAA